MSKGGDGGAGEMRQREAEKQDRINKSVDAINALFNGQPTNMGVGRALSFDPNATYYDASGNPVALPMRTETYSDQPAWGQEEIPMGFDVAHTRSRSVQDVDAINRMIANGELFTGVQAVNLGGNRDSLYDEQKQAVTDLNRREVDRQFGEAERANRFSLARNGLLGGSVDVDTNAEIQRRNNEGLTQAVALGDQAASDLRTSDERTRQSLISMAQSGIDTSTAHQMALSGLNANAQNAASARGGATIGNLFSDLATAYYANGVNNARNAGAAQTQDQWYGVSNPRSGSSGTLQR